MAINRTPVAPPPLGLYSVARGALQALQALIQSCGLNIPDDFLRHVEYIAFTAAKSGCRPIELP